MGTFEETKRDRDLAGRFTEMAGDEQTDLLAAPTEIHFGAPVTLDDLDAAEVSYLETALVIEADRWRSEYLDGVSTVTAADIDPVSARRLRAELGDFIDRNQTLILSAREAGYDFEQLGADFLLDRNGQGGGFRDRGLPGDLGEKLAASAARYGSQRPVIGEDGRVHLEGGHVPARG